MDYFVEKRSIVRKIWGDADIIHFIFAGAAAEFALNKAVDWLYFTGRLPADPLGRLFSTVIYARAIVFSEKNAALRTIDTMDSIHAEVEKKRGAKIPDWAYRDVLFMLIDYSIRSYELLKRKMSLDEKREVFQVFHRLGSRMGIDGLPENYGSWTEARKEHLQNNLEQSKFTKDLFKQYRKHLGFLRFSILMEAQKLVLPKKVKKLLDFHKASLLRPFVGLYKFSRSIKIDWLFKRLLLPSRYKKEIQALDNSLSPPHS